MAERIRDTLTYHPPPLTDANSDTALIVLMRCSRCDIFPRYTANDKRLPIIAKYLLEHGARTDVIDQEGNSALMLAVQHRSKETVQLLLDHHADVNAHNRYGYAALHRVDKELCELLLRYNDDVNIHTRFGDTP